MPDSVVSVRDHLIALLAAHEQCSLERSQVLTGALEETRRDLRALSERQQDRLGRAEYTVAHEDLRRATEDVAVRVSTLEGTSGGQARFVSVFFAALGAISVVAALVISVVVK